MVKWLPGYLGANFQLPFAQTVRRDRMARDLAFDSERGHSVTRPWSRPRSIVIWVVGLIVLFGFWSISTQTQRFGVHSSTDSDRGKFNSPAPVTPGTSETSGNSETPVTIPVPDGHSTGDKLPAKPEVVISGDREDTDFPKSAGFTGNVALIMEEEPTHIHNFASVVTHFRNTIDPSWEMVILTRRGWTIPPSRMLRKFLASGAIKVRFLPPEHDHFPTHASISFFLTSPWLWEQFENVNRLLMFQPDSILCSNSEAKVDDFVEWDMIGAPMDEKWLDSRLGFGEHAPHPKAQYFNGGLSIRNPRLFLDLARRYDFKKDFNSAPSEELPNFLKFEDHWFMRKLDETPELRAKAKLPSADSAGKFAVETLFYKQPLGYHQPHRWLPERYGEIAKWCPEVGMIYSMEMPDERWFDNYGTS